MTEIRLPVALLRVPLMLLLLRIGIFVVMFIWTIDKFVRPEHASKIFAGFYGIANLGNLPLYLIGTIELVILLAFLAGFQKRFSYGFVLLLHGISTLSSFKQYLTSPVPTCSSLPPVRCWRPVSRCTSCATSIPCGRGEQNRRIRRSDRCPCSVNPPATSSA